MSDIATLVVVPAYQEEQALPGTLKELHDVVPELDVLVVDDGSRDAHGDVSQRRATSPSRGCRSTSVWARPCAPASATPSTTVPPGGRRRRGRPARPGDDREPSSTRSTSGADMVIGSRFAEGSSFEVGRRANRAMKSLHRVVRWQTGQSFTDTTPGLPGVRRAGRRDARRDYPRRVPRRHGRGAARWCSAPGTRWSRCR